MDCRELTACLISMDNDDSLPAEAREHLAGCPRCAREANRFAQAVTSLQSETNGGHEATGIEAANPALTVRVMRAVRLAAERGEAPSAEAAVTEEQPTTLRNWIIVGTVLLAGVFGLRFSDVMNWLRDSFGPAIDVAMSVILGLFLTAYICMLVGSNLERVRRVLRLR